MKSEVEYSGLSESEVLASRERYGENILTPPARTPMWKLFLEKFSDPIIRILLVALLLSVAVAVYHIATGEARYRFGYIVGDGCRLSFRNECG